MGGWVGGEVRADSVACACMRSVERGLYSYMSGTETKARSRLKTRPYAKRGAGEDVRLSHPIFWLWYYTVVLFFIGDIGHRHYCCSRVDRT